MANFCCLQVCSNWCIYDYVEAKRKWQVSKSPLDYVNCTWPLDIVALFLLPHNLLCSNCCILICSNYCILVSNKTSLKIPLKENSWFFFYIYKNKFKGGGKEDLMCNFQNYKIRLCEFGQVQLNKIYTLAR